MIIPIDLENVLSCQAQAERERQAHLILDESEMQISHCLAQAAKAYSDIPTALHLHAMNMLFEGIKDKGSQVIVPSSGYDETWRTERIDLAGSFQNRHQFKPGDRISQANGANQDNEEKVSASSSAEILPGEFCGD